MMGLLDWSPTTQIPESSLEECLYYYLTDLVSASAISCAHISHVCVPTARRRAVYGDIVVQYYWSTRSNCCCYMYMCSTCHKQHCTCTVQYCISNKWCTVHVRYWYMYTCTRTTQQECPEQILKLFFSSVMIILFMTESNITLYWRSNIRQASRSLKIRFRVI